MSVLAAALRLPQVLDLPSHRTYTRCHPIQNQARFIHRLFRHLPLQLLGCSLLERPHVLVAGGAFSTRKLLANEVFQIQAFAVGASEIHILLL